MKEYYEIKEMLRKELKEYARKGELSAGSLDVIHKLTDTIKNLDKIEMLEEYEDYDESYDDGGSYARGRNARRDRMGKYNRDGYSRDDGKEHLMRNIREMMREARNDHEREAYIRVLDELENS